MKKNNMITKIPFILALLTMVGGIFIAILFGVNESYFKNKIKKGLSQNTKVSSILDSHKKEAVIQKESKKNWRYYQRFHFHATAIGTMSLVLLIFIQFIKAPTIFKNISSWGISTSGLSYPFIWLFAAIYGPEMGRTEAKEAFGFFGYTGGIYLIALCLIVFMIIKFPISIKDE